MNPGPVTSSRAGAPNGAARRVASAARQPRLPASVWWVLGGAWLWLGCTAAWRTLFLPDEGRYVGVAWEMARSGDWLTPTLNGLPFFHKPPLFYWITAAALDLFGPVEWAARLASIASAGIAVAALYAFLNRWDGRERARWGAFVLASQPMFFAGAQFANMDMLVAACVSVAVLLAAHAALLFESGRPHRRTLAGAYTVVALAILSKGLIGLVLPGLVMVVWLALAGRWRTVAALLWWPGPALAALLCVPWMALMQQRHAGFLHYFIVVQHVQRFAQSGFNSVEPWWFFVPVLAVFVLPWSAWLGVAARRAHAGAHAPTRLAALAWTWLGVVVVFFSVPQSKLIGYILPALAPMAMLIAQHAPGADEPGATQRWLWRTCAVIAPALCLATVVFYAHDNAKSSRDMARAIAALHHPGEGVAVLDDYLYDWMFYLGDTAPVVVVANWDPAEVAAHDNWRKELADAGAFAPVLARGRLLDSGQFAQALCNGTITWVVGHPEDAQRYTFLASAQRLTGSGPHVAWKLDATSHELRAALRCAAPAPRAGAARAAGAPGHDG